MLWKLTIKTTSHGRRPPTKNEEYLNNHWLDLFQTLNLGWGEQTKFYRNL